MTESIELEADYVDLLRELLESDVEFLLIGGWALAFHGHGRSTDDLDVLVRPTPENAVRVYAALDRFGAPLRLHGVEPSLFAVPRYGYRLGRKPVMIEILTSIDGVSFEDAERGSIKVHIAELTVPVIGRSALIENKRASGRPKDLADLDALTSERPSGG